MKEEKVKNMLWKIGVVLSLIFGSLVFGQAKLGYVDSQRVLSGYAPALDAQKKLEAENNQWAQELQRMQEQIKSLQDRLEQQSLLLSEAKKRESAQEIQNLLLKAQQFQNEKWGEEGEFFRRRAELLKPVFDKINAVIAQLGDEGGYDFIFDTQAGALLYAQPKYDLTDEVLSRLEKEIGTSGAQKTTTP